MRFKDLNVPFFTILFILVGIFLYTKLAGPIPFSINSTQTTKSNIFNAQGTGKATEIPNTALLSLGVTKTDSNAINAQTQTNSTANKIIQDLKNLGIEDKNIKTTNYSVYPNYDYNSGRQNITGYTVTQNLEVKIKPIDKANKALDTVTADGANLVGGISFVLDPETQKKLERKARDEAVKDAKEKAESLASSAGIRLGKIIDVQEGASFEPRPIMQKATLPGGLGGSAEDQTQITPGENTVTITVTIYYETF